MTGRAWVFGDDVDTDALAPGAFMAAPVDVLAAHCLTALNPDFAREVRPGDIVIAGRNFGAGSSREQAAEALKHLGVRAVVALSFAGIFYRNAFNLGLPLVVCPDIGGISAGDRLSLDAATGIGRNETTGADISCEPVPAHLMAMVRDGGLIAQLAKRFSGEEAGRSHDH